MRVVVRPSRAQTQAPEHTLRKRQAVCGIRIGDISNRVVAGRIVVAVLEEEDVVTQSPETDDVLQVVPGDSPERSPHPIAQHDDTQSRCSVLHLTIATSWNDARWIRKS